MKLEKITFCPDGDEPVDFYVLEQTKIAGVNYILVTDFEDGDYATLMHSLDKLKSYPDDTIVYPGHEYETTILIEKKYNPYFK